MGQISDDVQTLRYYRNLHNLSATDALKVDCYKYNDNKFSKFDAYIDAQTFTDYATGWERSYSVLCRRKTGFFSTTATGFGHPPADPVVDKELMIVGHYGWFKGNHIWVPRSRPIRWGHGELSVMIGLQDLVDAGYPVFVQRQGESDFESWSTDEQLYRLLTDPHGRVLLYTGYDLLGLQDAEDLLFVIGMAYAVGKLVAYGVKAGVRSLIRRFGREEAPRLRRPKLPKGVIQDDPPAVNIGRMGRPGLIGIVEKGDDKVVYNVKSIIFEGAQDAAEEENIRIARLAHREMIERAAQEAQKKGQRQFILHGTNASPNFQAHANKLAREIGVPGSGKSIPSIPDAYPHYEVTLDVNKVLQSQ